MAFEKTKQERLFFALWPTDTVRQQMLDCIQRLPEVHHQGRLVNPNNLHITIHFLGNIDLERIDCFIQHANTISSQPFTLSLNRTGYFKKPRVLWLGCDLIPDTLLQLHHDLGSKIHACGFTQESRAYSPHVTVSRKISEPEMDQQIETIRWPVDAFVLVKSITHSTGVEYQIRQKFVL